MNSLLQRLSDKYGSIIVQLHGSSTRLSWGFKAVLEHNGYNARGKTYIDMAIDSPRLFKPYHAPGVRVVELGEQHAADYAEVEATRGRKLSPEEASRLLRTLGCYGAYVEGVLASIACTYIRMHDIWLIGNVYTRPEYRGRGLAKAVTSTVTARALACGAKPLLHVEAGNKPAIRVYARLGYRALRARPWIFAHRATL
ncbi:GNAT family N-acetyltransferase [Hyperthermus butylicus]|uniref:Acetyltransferase n=1 Tax=Hyperthermus butylicus (strain DSM 5456 / JCM 9403 / PLM1-5) TaxID=415426 RepID=A2BKE8_HYPBU|nr:GNAT family N-acetyltransferase [Hyperthermus butylicus]ABM80459.1 putative Acetyltransferase [Hyperthermus butylicus DSM 5456]